MGGNMAPERRKTNGKEDAKSRLPKRANQGILHSL